VNFELTAPWISCSEQEYGTVVQVGIQDDAGLKEVKYVGYVENVLCDKGMESQQQRHQQQISAEGEQD